jgi:hypothetical protein
MKRLALLIAMLSSPASAQFYSYNDFDKQPPTLNYYYVTGEIDMFLAIQHHGLRTSM